MIELTLAILSWGSHKTLWNTLKSYEKSGLLKVADQKIIWFQEMTFDDTQIAEVFGFIYNGNPISNIGIAGGYKKLLEMATEPYFLFLENDWENIATKESTAQQMGLALGALQSGVVDLVRLRHRYNPGHPLWTLQFAGKEYDRPTHLLDSVHWQEHPENFNEITEILPRFYMTSSQNANWTNNPHMACTEFLRENIVPRLDGDIEKTLQPWWEQQEFTIAQGTGLFTHNRIG